MKVEGGTNVAIFFIGASVNSFLGGVFALPIDDSTCPTTLVVSGDHIRLWYHCSVFHTFINIVVCFHQRAGSKLWENK